jgi:hypothetical protein
VIESVGRPPTPCIFVGSGNVTASGGQARGVVTSGDGVILLEETYVFTSPTTLTATGTATRVSGGPPTQGTFTGDFTAVPTADPNVLLDFGTITVRAN